MKIVRLVLIVLFVISAALSNEVVDEAQQWISDQVEDVSAYDMVQYLNQRGYGDVTFGSETVYESDTPGNVNTDVAALSSTAVVFVYYESGGSASKAVIGTISGNTISLGAESTFNAYSNQIAIISLSATSFVIAYQDWQPTKQGRAVAATVSGTTITFGSEATFNPSATTLAISACSLSSTKFVVSYRDNGASNTGYSRVGTVSGTTISFSGSETQFNAGVSSYTDLAALDASKFVVAYQDGGNGNYGTARVGTVTGSAISYGAEVVFNSGSTTYLCITSLDASTIAIAYTDAANSNYGTAIIGTIIGTAPDFSSSLEYVFNTASTTFPDIHALSSTTFITGYTDGGNSSYGTAKFGSVAGTVISYGAESVYNAATTSYNTITSLASGKFVSAYIDNGDIDNAAVVGDIDVTVTITISGTTTYDGSYTLNGSRNGKNKYTHASNYEISYDSSVGNGQWQLLDALSRAVVSTNYYECGGADASKPPASSWIDGGPPSLAGDVCVALSNDDFGEFPIGYSLSNPYPNPFNPVTTVDYYLPELTEISIEVLDMNGHEIEELVQGTLPAGYHSIRWNASDYASGVYFIRMIAPETTEVQKVILLK